MENILKIKYHIFKPLNGIITTFQLKLVIKLVINLITIIESVLNIFL